MYEGNHKEINLEHEIESKLVEISRKTDLPLNKVINAVLLYGYYRFWYPLQQYFAELEVEEQPIKEEEYEPVLAELKDQIDSSLTIIPEIGKYEKKFEKRNPYGTFQDFEERHIEFIKFVEESMKPEERPKEKPSEKLKEKSIEKDIPSEVEETKEEETSLPEPPVKNKNYFKTVVAYFTPQIHGVWDIIELVIFFIITGLACFYFFWGVNTALPTFFNFVYFYMYYPISIPFIILFIVFVTFIIGFIIGKLLYYPIHKIEKKLKKED